MAPSTSRSVAPAEAYDDQDGFNGKLLGLREMKAAFRRRRRFLVFAAVCGLLIGGALHIVLPRSYKAVSNLYLVEPPGVIPADAMANEVSLLQTRAVARQAASYLPGHPDAQSIATSYKGQAVSGSILSISATGRSPEAAIALNAAVDKAFLAVRSDGLRRETNVVVAGLQAQITNLKGDSNTVQFQQSQLETSALSAQLNLKSSVEGSFVLDPAQTVRVSMKKVTIEDTLSGLIAGFALGAGTIVTREMLSDRAWRREDVAADLGVAVEMSLTRRGRRMRPRRGGFGEASESPAVMVQRRLRAHLDALGSRSLAIFSVGDELVAADAVSSLASALASDGENVFVIDMAKGHPIARRFRIRGNSDPVQKVELDGCSLTLLISPDYPAQGVDTIVRDRTDYVLLLANADPAFGVEHVAAWATEGVAIVTAGKSTHLGLVGVGRMVRRAGIVLRSSILLDADRHDDSVGFLDSGNNRGESRRSIDIVPVA